ncbi:hypothetical protein BDF14DRAFT_1855096 [Spinellus fusiger]|nr:hypothetical protein BDF14DRAFT_1855096 [Spinellus fusiger]
MYEVLQDKPFNCFPLRRIFIPSYMTIDTRILNTHLLKRPIISHLDKDRIWGKKELAASIGKCVLIDPGRRDVLYCMHEDSTVENKRTY